ncbi:hypothetical protein CkaCkLH20_06249 [Colletotrichum karsti]|uniref:Uncharacterized protein n=1 Tax=Colletotrichum karsti TaxID=1095194 RepID=A0A9P6I9A3_9PEZI|nr:uncharacterized protein CkaCkLH20_06249 [Colletotrichum karsti]KAF9876306.1 hypothetical protein CkaCkLH20_06249 [Colletotrichum karsti]
MSPKLEAVYANTCLLPRVRYLREMACHIEMEQWKRRARDTNAHAQKCQEEKERRAALEEELRGRLNLINFEMLRKEDQVKELKTELATAELDRDQMRAEIETSQVAQANLQLRIDQAEEEKTKSVKKASSASKKRWKTKEQQLRATIRSLEGDMEQEKGDLEAEISALREKEILFQKQSEDASINTKNLEFNIEKLKDSHSREGEKAKSLQEQLDEHKKREDSVQRLEQHLTSISTKVEKLTEKSAQADGVSSNVMDRSATEVLDLAEANLVRLDKLLELVKSTPRAPDADAIGGILKEFQDQVVSNFAQEVKHMTTAQSDVQGKVQSIQECLRTQSALVAEHKEQQQQLLQCLSKQGGESASVWQLLRSKEEQLNNTANAVIEMRQRFEAFIKTSEDHDRGGASDADLRAAVERLRESEAKVAHLETNLRNEHTAHEARETILKERLTTLEASRGSMERETTEERAKFATVSTKNQKLEKSLADANQRVCNLTMKLRDSQTAQKDPTDVEEKTPQELERELQEQHRVMSLCHKMLEDIQEVRVREATQEAALAYKGNESTNLQEPGSSSSSHGSSQMSTADKNGWDSNDDEIEVSRTAPVAEADKDYEIVISDNSDDSDGEEDDVLVPDTQLDERAVQVKRLVMRSPIEEPDQSPEPPSVAEERQKRRSSTNPGSGPTGILRRTTSSLQPVAVDAPGSTQEISLITHAGHTRYNRPVGSGNAIASAQFLVPRRRNGTGKSKAVTAGNVRSASILSSPFLRQLQPQGVKRAQSQPPDGRQPKRTKSVYDELSSDDPLSSSYAHEPDGINADETETDSHTLRSPHFRKGKETIAATQNLKQGPARQPLAEKTHGPQQPPSSSNDRRILKTYSKTPEADDLVRAKVNIF